MRFTRTAATAAAAGGALFLALDGHFGQHETLARLTKQKLLLLGFHEVAIVAVARREQKASLWNKESGLALGVDIGLNLDLTFWSKSSSFCKLAKLRLSCCCMLLICEFGLAGQLESGDIGSSLMTASSISMSEQISGDMLPSRAEDTEELQSLSSYISARC